MRENFDFAVIIVAYPPSLHKLPNLRKILIDNGHIVFVQSFIGKYEGKEYPYAYTKDEKELIRSISFSRHDYEFFVEAIKPNLCNSGYKSFYVDMSGEVIPCGMGIKYESMGNLVKSTDIKLNNRPQICRGTTCMCDTENVNTVVFEKFYARDSKNQHIYKYRRADEAVQNPELDEWKVDYTDKDKNL